MKTEKITKREYFIAKAMQALLSNPEWMILYEGDKYLMQKEIVSQTAINYADAVLQKLIDEPILK